MIEQDHDGYVMISNLHTEKGSDGTTKLVSGTIHINKDLAGKAIDISVIGQDSSVVATTDYVFIADQDINPPKTGDNRTFQTQASLNGEIMAYHIIVRDLYRYEHFTDYLYAMNGAPMNLMFGPPSGFSGQLSVDQINRFFVRLDNTTQHAWTVSPVNMELEVYKSNEQNQELELVYSYKLPTINGTIDTKSGYYMAIPWNQRGNDGQFISPGRYLVKLSRPDTITYLQADSKEVQTYTVETDTRHPWKFFVEYVK
ncbi:hypothetical protein [Paenibacillus sp. N3.4]|uniref:hypothetical protein n=1 Tax=Paenibacillus sp. N3.4 TaxID=2603222 RepID=UPI0011CCB54A|nr:hypothetical protein [Paenibacillus sp. N3.4]TXK77576.1 hypothetical protein FU659_22540 [Paenibacillus sp. N3.4]